MIDSEEDEVLTLPTTGYVTSTCSTQARFITLLTSTSLQWKPSVTSSRVA
jgi:hypothetical protein